MNSQDAERYVRNFAIIKWGDIVDPEEVEDWPCTTYRQVSELLKTEPRDRAEAAYVTLSQVRETHNA